MVVIVLVVKVVMADVLAEGVVMLVGILSRNMLLKCYDIALTIIKRVKI